MKKILVLVGPSAVGKTTVMKELLSKELSFSFVRSATTRPPRNDGHNSEYLYLSKEEFEEKIKRGEMLEYMEYAGNFYGTPAYEIERILSSSEIPLLILDIKGVRSLRSMSLPYEVFAVYIYSSVEKLNSRLYERVISAGKTPEAIFAYEKRVKQNAEDYRSLTENLSLFDALVENTSPKETASKILDLFSSDSETLKREKENSYNEAKRII